MKTYTKANKRNTFSMMALLWMGSFGVFGQSVQTEDWNWQNPLPTGNALYEVRFIDAQNGWAIGLNSTILKTTNGGTTWQRQSSGITNNLYSVHFSNAQNGWAVGNLGTILKTSNGGSSWQSQSSGTSNDLSYIQFIDSQIGWAVGYAGTILKTSNGGNSWISQNSGTINYLYSAYFIDSQIGWVVGHDGTIRKTTNGGSSWISQSSGTTNGITSIQFSDSQLGWAVGNGGTIRKTTNGGSSWITQNSGTTNDLLSVHFTNAQTGWAVEGFGAIRKTTNGGSSWINQSSGTALSLYSINFIDSQTGWAVGYGGTILKTNNGGNNWISQSRRTTTNELRSVFFSNPQTGWAVGVAGTILKTSNGGNSWNSQSSGTNNQLNAVHFINIQTGWAVGLSGRILKTSNGGSSWVNQSSGTTEWFNSVYFIDAQTGWAVGTGGSIRKTSNGGSNWLSQSSGTTNSLQSVHFINGQTGWVVGDNGVIRKTSNGGSSWISQISGTTSDFSSCHFTDAQTGWTVGESATIRKTSNGGSSWISQSGGTNDLYSVHFIDTQIGWAVGRDGIILKTSNGGNSWISQKSGTTNWLYSIHFTDAQTGWAVGENGTIINTISNNPISSETPSTLLTGNLFEKTTANCTPSQIPVPSRLVKAEPGPYYGISDNQGRYNLRLPLSDTATPITLQTLGYQDPAFNVEVVCPPNNQYNVLLDTLPDTLSNKDFGFKITPCHHLDVQLASNRRRRCFRNTTSISYSNQGSLSAPEAYVLVEFPKWVRPVSSSRTYVALNDSVWRFNLDTVKAGFGGNFTITDSVLCGNVGILGLSQCTKATIYPEPNCPSGNWNGASLSGAGKCLGNGSVRVSLANLGTGDMLDSSSYRIYLDSILVFQKKVKLVQNDSVVLQVQANGKLVHVEADQVANHPTQYSVTLNVEGCGLPSQTISKGFVNKFPLAQSPNSKTHCLPIQGAYDPNDKTVVPQGFTNQNIIPPNTQLEYLVRFQNTGNDTAFTVYVIDTLDNNLNPESLELGAASHNYQLSMQTVKSGKTFLRWQFNNIQLPDSTTNKLKSNGFIQYRISPKTNLALGSKVRNHAEIYFDFNPPIITNQTLSNFGNVVYKDSTLNGNVQIVTALPGKLSPKQIGVNLYPNPVTEHSLTADFQTKGSLTLFNAQGQLVYEKQNIEGKQVLPIQLRTGFYMAQLKTDKGISVVKVIVE